MMNPHYKDPVIIFGMVAPVLLIVITFGLGVHFRGKFEKTYEARKDRFDSFKVVEVQREALQKKINSQEPHLNRWMALFEKSTTTAVSSFFSGFQKKYGGQEFQLTSISPSSTVGGIGGVSEQPSIQLQLGFRGTFRALQTAFLELETRMPQLQMDSFKISVDQPNRKVLNMNLVYTAWQKQ